MGSSLIGQVLENQFRVDAFVDSGAMGAVYRVWDLNRNVPLAMKVLHVDLAEDPSMLKHFRREANALKKLTHPNIVPFYGLYQTEDFTFLLEHFIDGTSLKDLLRLKRGDPLELVQALTYLKALCAALGYAHLHGVVHCDVKPGNVLIDQGGQIYLTDFGIARHAESTLTTLASAGTTAYMAPEQIRGEPVSPATDIYALGVILFEMLAGQRPFRGSDSDSDSSGSTAAERIRYAHLHLAPPNPRNLNPSLPEGLAFVILKALSKQPELRYLTTHQLFTEAIGAAGLQAGQVPDRSSTASPWKPEAAATIAAAAPTVIPSAPPVVAAAGSVSASPAAGVSAAAHAVPASSTAASASERVMDRQGRSKSRRNLWLAGLLVVFLAVALCTATGTAANLLSGLALFPSPPIATERVVVNTTPPTHKPPTQKAPQVVKPSPTAKRKTPTPEPARPTKAPVRPSPTPRPVLPTPVPPMPEFTALENMFCRDGPDPDAEAHVTLQKGDTLPVLRRWGGGPWLLLGINRSDTRTRCCWVGGEGSLNVGLDSIQVINYLPDRIRCELSP